LPEAVNELIDETDIKKEVESDLIRKSALIASVLFFAYFIFILPGPSISPEELTQYSWINQSLIESKILIKDLFVNLFNNPSNPGNPGGTEVSPISPSISEGVSTITPNTPIVPNIPIETGTQTNLTGITVGRMVESFDNYN